MWINTLCSQWALVYCLNDALANELTAANCNVHMCNP